MLDTLVSDLNKLCDEHPFHTGWYLKDLRTGETADRHGHVVVPSASTRKIAIMMTALKAVHEGRLTLDQPVTIQAKYQNNDSGCFQHLRPGFTIQLFDALVMMIIVSDNTCTGTVADMVGLDQVNALCQSIGMRGTMHRHGMPPHGLGRDHPLEAVNVTTPADVGLLLELILQGTQDPAVAARLGCTPESVSTGPRHFELAEAAQSSALLAARRDEGGSQDRHRRAQSKRRWHHLLRGPAMVHFDGIYRAPTGRNSPMVCQGTRRQCNSSAVCAGPAMTH